MDDVLASGRHFGGICTRLLLEFVEWRLGHQEVAAILAEADEQRCVAALLDDVTWSTYDQFRRLLETAARHLGSAEELLQIGEMPSIGVGSKPEILALFEAFGSPVNLALAVGNGFVGPALDLAFDAVGPTELIVRAAVVGGLEPFPELCAFIAGLLPLSVRIFGLQALEVAEVRCCHRGDDTCVFRVVWDETEDLTLQLEFAHFQRGMAESRLASFQRTVEDIVSSDDLDTVLARIVEAAARSTTATGFVLEVDALPRATCRYVDGVDLGRAEEIAARAAAGESGYLVVEVASNHRTYGRFIVLDPTSGLVAQRPALEGYARLAATALHSAFALEEARRQADMSRALLELSTSLAELTTAGELAAKVVRAMPAVIDSDCAVVLLMLDGVARVAAHHGFEASRIATLDAFEIPVPDGALEGVIVRTTVDATPVVASILAATELQALAAAPISVDDTLIGLLAAGVRTRPERILDDPHLAERFSGLAGQAAVALRNGRLLDQIRHQSLHDPLTDLPNRALVLDRAEQMMARARRNRQAAAVLFVDLDGFKEINDTLGHSVGDDLLRIVAARLRTATRESDTVGRIGGDEFVVLVEDAARDAGVEAVAERLLHMLREPLLLQGRDGPVTVQASVGIATSDHCEAGDLLRDADIALYSAKAAGKGCYRVFASEMHDTMRSRAELAEGLGVALERNELFLVYQPIFDLGAETTTGVEALLRWNHPRRGVVPPDEFVPLLEESGLIVDVGRWVLHEACRQTVAWHAEGHRIDVSVNASIRQLERPDFVDDVRRVLASTELPPTSLILEITETAIMRDAEATIAVLERIKEIGVRVAIDDFGTGYSSLAYLRQFPVDALKIDRSFIASVADSPAADELIHTLVRLGKALELETLAEGIEHRHQLEHLQRQGCDSGQGYLFARPMRASEMASFLARRMHPVAS